MAKENFASPEYVKDLLEIQKNTILSFFKETFSVFNERLDRVAADVQELKTGLNFCGDKLKEKTDNADKELCQLKSEMLKATQIQGRLFQNVDELKKKSIEAEDRSRRNNLRIDGITENRKENWNETKTKLQELFEQKLLVNGAVIERAHRVGKAQEGQPRTIVCKLLNYNDKERIRKNTSKLKGSGIYVNDDFSEETLAIRKELYRQQRTHRENGKFARVSYNRLIVRDFTHQGED